MDETPIADRDAGACGDQGCASPAPPAVESLGRAYADTLRMDASSTEQPDGPDLPPDEPDPADACETDATDGDVEDDGDDAGDGGEDAGDDGEDAEDDGDDVGDDGDDAPDARASARVRVKAKNILEAMLFVGGGPLPPERACELIRGLTKEKVRQYVTELNQEYEADGRPFEVWDEADGLVLQVTDEFIPAIKRLHRRSREATLSRAALETLAVVAYQQPVGRQEIEVVRGVGCAAQVRMLLARGLLQVVERAEAGSHGTRYGTTDRFLEMFHLRSVDDLPRIDDLDRL